MKFVRFTLGPLCLLASTSLLATDKPSPDLARTLQLTTSGQEIRVSGAGAGGSVVLIGIARRPLAGAASVESWVQTLADDDEDGIATLDLGREVPLKSAWGAIDLATGNAGVAVAEGFPLEIIRPGVAGFELDAVSQRPLIRLERSTAQFLLVRPGFGAWALKAYDGGSGDMGNLEDGVPDGALRVDPTAFEPLQPEFGEFPGLSARDWIGAIDERQLTIFILRGADAPVGN